MMANLCKQEYASNFQKSFWNVPKIQIRCPDDLVFSRHDLNYDLLSLSADYWDNRNF